MFAELAKANSCSVLLFYHQKVKEVENWNTARDTCSFDTHKDSCQLPQFPVEPKSASFVTFRHTIAALSRISGCYPIINYDRKLVGQTGEGHFSPITGYSTKMDKSIVLDVARFKYPSHWIDLQTVYDSLGGIDLQSGLPRGFVVLARSVELFPDICRLAQDYSMMSEFTQFYRQPSNRSLFLDIASQSPTTKALSFLQFINDSPLEFTNLITLFIIQLTFILDTNRNSIGLNMHSELRLTSELHPEFAETKFTQEHFDKYPVLQILADYQPAKYKHVLAYLYAIFEVEYTPKDTLRRISGLKSSHNYLFT